MEEIDSTKFARKILTVSRDDKKENDFDLDPQNEEFISLNKKTYRTLRKAFKLNIKCKNKIEAQQEIDWCRSKLVKKYIERYGKKELIAYKFDFNTQQRTDGESVLIIGLTMLLQN